MASLIPLGDLLTVSTIGFAIMLAVPALLGRVELGRPELRWLIYTLDAFTSPLVMTGYVYLLATLFVLACFGFDAPLCGSMAFWIALWATTFVVLILPFAMMKGWLIMLLDERVERRLLGTS